MIKSRFEWIILILIVSILGTAWVIDSREAPAKTESSLTEAPIVGHLAPDVTVTTYDGQQSFVLSEIVDREGSSGKPVVLNFWATWCAPCRIEMPHFERASLNLHDEVVILGVNQGETADSIAKFNQTMGVTYPLLLDEGWVTSHRYGVANLPTTIFIDAQGVVQEVFIGTMNQAVLESKIKRLEIKD